MLRDKDAVANIAAKDMGVAGRFYETILGLTKADEMDGMITFKSGGTKIFVYRSDYAGTNKATAMTWIVGDEIETIVSTLKSKGVRFEHYDMPGLEVKGDIHVGGDMKAAWFKDPDGNILALVSG